MPHHPGGHNFHRLRVFQKIFQVKAWLKYRWRAGNRHGLHSPFVYRWYENIADSRKEYYVFNDLRDLRNELSLNTTMLPIQDFGAGSSLNNRKKKKVSQILSHSVKAESSGQRLFKMADMAEPGVILELGTSLGLSTLYLAMARKKSKVYTLEGSPEIHQLAKQNFEKLGAKNIMALEGNFDLVLPTLLSTLPEVDFVFMDGNHQYDSTLKYWEWLLPKLSRKAVVVLDDIHWSKGMQDAWEEILKSNRVRISVDLYDMGVLFLDPELKRQDFVLSV